ncbi:hypothetical protein Y1Q_0015206 [Alligator mississippiensis]|uniref:Aminotransferase class I/classII domain-containing protein n=1 Tax=Alligator mississippiensis TaxID=8496 RepID=A0A151NJV3_ALLMI|nr:hypothetical protein Y1Q_0015206 [Alligator mississippiensis]
MPPDAGLRARHVLRELNSASAGHVLSCGRLRELLQLAADERLLLLANEARSLEPDAFFCRELLEAMGIVLVPGSVFGQRPGTHHVRLSLLPPAEMPRTVLETVVDFHGAFLHAYA